MHLADTFIQCDLQCIQTILLFFFISILCHEPANFCTANAMLYH